MLSELNWTEMFHCMYNDQKHWHKNVVLYALWKLLICLQISFIHSLTNINGKHITHEAYYNWSYNYNTIQSPASEDSIDRTPPHHVGVGLWGCTPPHKGPALQRPGDGAHHHTPEAGCASQRGDLQSHPACLWGHIVWIPGLHDFIDLILHKKTNDQNKWNAAGPTYWNVLWKLDS